MAELDRKTVIEHIDDLIQRGCIAVGSLIFFPKLRLTEVGERRPEELLRIMVLAGLPEDTSAVTSVSEPTGSGQLYTEKTFWPKFFEDLSKVRKRVIILSAFVSVTERTNQLHECFQAMMRRGVIITVYTRTIEEHGSESTVADAIRRLRGIGVKVIERSRLHYKIAILDRAVAWEGSLNILSHYGSEEHMRRFEGSDVADEILRNLGL